jgi:transcriptional regulator with XRE-family HTH domain
MTTDSRNELGKLLKQRRVMVPLTLQELARAAGVSSSHLGRVERGERFPSARILRRIAKPLGFDEAELFTLADYLPQSVSRPQRENLGRLDPYAASVLASEPVEVQHAVIGILFVLKSIGRGVAERGMLRTKSTIELQRLVTSRETPEATRNMAQEVLFERGSSDLPEFREYARRKYPNLDEDLITMIEDLIKRQRGQSA